MLGGKLVSRRIKDQVSIVVASYGVGTRVAYNVDTPLRRVVTVRRPVVGVAKTWKRYRDSSMFCWAGKLVNSELHRECLIDRNTSRRIIPRHEEIWRG